MKVYVMVDIEGISGIYMPDQVSENTARTEEGRRFITEDINACVAGLRAAGVEEICVHDCHGSGEFLDWYHASADADYYISGYVGDRRYVNLPHYDGIILLGYHAMAGTEGAILEHTYSSADVQNLYLNGKKVGEIAIDAAIAGEQGVPVLMVSGDDKACAEAKTILPSVITAEVKKGLSTTGGMLLPRERAHKLLFEKAKEAVQKAAGQTPYVVQPPIAMKFEKMERNRVPRQSVKPYMTVQDGRTFTVTADTVEEALWRAFW